MAAKSSTITVHHLNYSRSTRILWFLEEIGMPYDIVRHERLPGFRAPDSLRRVHPLGKAPVITDGELVIAESGVILEYLDKTYAGRRFTPTDPVDHWHHAEWMVSAESMVAPALMTCLYGKLIGGFAGIFEGIVAREAGNAIALIEDAVGPLFLLGPELKNADFQMAYVLELANYLGMLKDYPKAAAYLLRLKERPALRRALEIGGPMVPPIQ